MKRRNFLILGSILGISPYIEAKSYIPLSIEFDKLRAIFEALQEHLFPTGSLIPSAKSMKLTQFLYNTMNHHSFDKDIKAFVLKGAKKLDKRTKGKFITMNIQAKEKALREYEKTNFGRNWLSRIIMMSMEGIFCDPIYGSNIGEAGWKSIDTYGGNPRPKTKYLGL
ncbi:MAG: gluconate 2-dehydrogenase subunit 3 family protein [Sulfurovum sp.]